MSDQPDTSGSGADENRIVVITPDGMGVATSGHGDDEGHDSRDSREVTNPADLVEQPAKVMRIGSMIKNLLDEVRNAPLDEAGRLRLAEIHRRSIDELKDGLAPELVEELDRIALPFG
ncbi:MAG TPA: DUF2587 domain-containing protein, partial [Dermatophilaceae bacterium]|nr:DUF2587 domain-containing protein [Dermatophilaceae bacterium]